MSFKKYLTILILVVPLIFALPRQAAAVNWFPLVPCGLNQQPKDSSGIEIPKSVHDYMQPCNQCLLVELGKNIIDMTFYAIVPSVGTLLFLIAGFIILFNARSGNPAGVGKGKQIMKDTAIGIAIVLSSWLITNFILKSLAPNQAAGVCLSSGICDTDASKSCKANSDCPGTPWYQIQCRVGSLKDLTDATLPSVGGGSTGGGTGGNTGGDTGPTGPGAQCTYSGVNLCQAKSMGCSNSLCSQYVSSINKWAGRWSVDANLIKAVIMKESSCDATKSNASGNSYGLMAFQPGTAIMVGQYCGVDKANAGNPAWLTDPKNSDAVICMGAYYLNSIGTQGQCGSNVENIAAGYNAGPGNCVQSDDCPNETSCTDNGPKRKWECLYDDTQHKVCNTKLNETKDYAPKVLYCYNNPGF